MGESGETLVLCGLDPHLPHPAVHSVVLPGTDRHNRGFNSSSQASTQEAESYFGDASVMHRSPALAGPSCSSSR